MYDMCVCHTASESVWRVLVSLSACVACGGGSGEAYGGGGGGGGDDEEEWWGEKVRCV